MRKILLSLFFVIPSISYSQALILDIGAKVVMAGVFSAGSGQPVPGIYVLPSSNPHNCLYSGVLFTNTSNMKEALAIALTAKATNAPVRIDYTKIADGSCIGSSIYIQ